MASTLANRAWPGLASHQIRQNECDLHLEICGSGARGSCRSSRILKSLNRVRSNSFTTAALSSAPAPDKIPLKSLENAVLPPNELPTGSERIAVSAERAFNRFATDVTVSLLDSLYSDETAVARFYVLETIARVPYFAFVSVLHCYESFGWWRRTEYLKVHFEENMNEVHHLMIMEALGGDERWIDRFVAQHIAVVYFFFSAIVYALSPRMAYNFSECVELHAFDTYDKHLKKHGERLKQTPAPKIAVDYYTGKNSLKFADFQSALGLEPRYPKIENLYDVFINIRDDEAEHCKTMRKCQSAPSDLAASLAVEQDIPPPQCSGIIECAVNSSSYADRMKQAKK